MKRAIFNYTGKAPNRGGPTGYLYNLFEGMPKDEKPDLLFVKSFGDNSEESSKKTKKDPSEMRRIIYFLKQGIRARKAIGTRVNDYSFIHVHSSEDVLYLKYFCKFKGKIIFTPHRPEPLFFELKKATDSKNGLYYHFCQWIEKQSYKLAAAFIFPSPGAKSIYRAFPGFEKNSIGKPAKYVYTGVRKKEITKSRNDYRREHDLPLESKIISYVGRHNLIKGYDRVVDAFESVKKTDSYVIVAGTKSDISYPKDKAWIELGYIDDVQNLMNAVDIVAIPNRNTYFDLVIIEALSLGKIVISSNTGGNKDITQKTKGLVLFDNEIDGAFEKAVIEVLEMPTEGRINYERENIRFYEEYCSLDKFGENYLRVLNDICKEI